jgi:energy-coupling factor transport system permease protein
MKAFSDYHPFVLMAYFSGVTALTMFTMHPVFLGLSFLGAAACFAMLSGRRVFLSNTGFYIPVFILIAATNPLFSHNGETILFFLNDNRVTVEAVIYGVAIAFMLTAVIFWFKCYSEVMTSDKFIYLFGKTVPKLSLVLSMALRFTPLFARQVKRINKTQKTLGLYAGNGFADKLAGGVRVFSSILTWSLENAVDTADSMKARGYGLPGRTHFSLFKFTKRDAAMLIIIAVSILAVLAGIIAGEVFFKYYPVITGLNKSAFAAITYIFFAAVSFIPYAVEVKESLKWKYLISKI